MIFDNDIIQQNSVKELMDELLDKDIIPQREIVKMKKDVVIHTNPNLIMNLRHEERKERRKSLTQNKDEFVNISDKNLIKKDSNKIKETLLINDEIKKIEQQFETESRKLISDIKKSTKNKKSTNKPKIKSCSKLKNKSKIENEEKIKGTNELQNMNITTQIYKMPNDIIKDSMLNNKLNDIENDLINLSEINKYLSNLDNFDEENLNISDDIFSETVEISNTHFKCQELELKNNKNESQSKYPAIEYDISRGLSQDKYLELNSDNSVKDIKNFNENKKNYIEKCIVNNHLSQNCADKCENIEINYSSCYINDEEVVSDDYNIITAKNLSHNANYVLDSPSTSINDISIEVLDVKPLKTISENIVLNKPVKRDKNYVIKPSDDDIIKHYCDEVMACSIQSNDKTYNQNDDILDSSISRKIQGLIEEINNSNLTIKPKSINKNNLIKNQPKDCTIENKKIIEREKYLLRKFWHKWSDKIKKNNKKEIILKNTVDDKFDNFLNNLEKRIAERKLNFNNKMNFSSNNDEKQKESSISVKGSSSSEIYKNRFKAQKHIIEHQKLLLEEQNKKIKLLEEEDIKIKHINNKDNKDIKNPIKIKCKKKKVENTNLLKTPKFVENMNKRAEERSEKRQQLKLKKEEKDLKLKIQHEEEKMRVIEEKKYAALQAEQMEYLKKIIEEENRKKEIEFIKNAVSKVKALNRNIILTYYMNLWKKVLILRKDNFAKADLFYKTNLMKKSFRALKEHAESSKEEKMKKAELLRICELERKYWDIWFQKWKENRDMSQVAEDYNDMRLSNRVLIALLWNKVQNRKRDDELMQLAAQFHRRQLLSKAFRSLRNYPKIMFKEREKEKRLRSWEEKVKEIIPDFSIT